VWFKWQRGYTIRRGDNGGNGGVVDATTFISAILGVGKCLKIHGVRKELRSDEEIVTGIVIVFGVRYWSICRIKYPR
jgi:hypothetical protein